jgi:hypothetical protein
MREPDGLQRHPAAQRRGLRRLHHPRTRAGRSSGRRAAAGLGSHRVAHARLRAAERRSTITSPSTAQRPRGTCSRAASTSWSSAAATRKTSSEPPRERACRWSSSPTHCGTFSPPPPWRKPSRSLKCPAGSVIRASKSPIRPTAWPARIYAVVPLACRALAFPWPVPFSAHSGLIRAAGPQAGARRVCRAAMAGSALINARTYHDITGWPSPCKLG